MQVKLIVTNATSLVINNKYLNYQCFGEITSISNYEIIVKVNKHQVYLNFASRYLRSRAITDVDVKTSRTHKCKKSDFSLFYNFFASNFLRCTQISRNQLKCFYQKAKAE